MVHIKDLRDIGLITDDMLVIQEDPENNRFQDITHAASLFKCRPIYGFYDDGWLDERASVQVMAGSTGEIHLSFHYPRDLTCMWTASRRNILTLQNRMRNARFRWIRISR